MCAYEDAEVLGVRLEYFISGRQSEFLAGQLAVGKILAHTSPLTCLPSSICICSHPREL